MRIWLKTMMVVCVVGLLGCGEDAEESGLRCGPDEVENPIMETCDRVSGDSDTGDGDGEPGDGEPGDGEPGDGEPGDGDPGDGDSLQPPLRCEPGMDPDLDVECTFFAHSPSTLYEIDPFRETVEAVGTVPSDLFDIDTHPDGTIYGISTTTLYKLGVDDTEWSVVGSMGQIANANGLCINTSGIAYLTAHDGLYGVDLDTANTSLIGQMGSSYTSSGDCVIDKGNRLYMSANSTDLFGTGTDNLVEIDAATATATMVGDTGFQDIYGLTAAWDFLIGTTGSSQVILIDRHTGAAELLFTAPGNISFYGAASTPGR